MIHDIQAVTFDVGGTLIEPWPSVGHVYARVAEEQGVHGLSPDKLNERFVSAWKRLDCRAESREDWAAIVRATFDGVATFTHPDVLFQTLYTRFMQPSCWRVFDDVVPTLKALRKRRIRLGILSNWDDRLRPLLERLGLAGFFEVVVVSCEVDCRKPEVRIFHLAAQAFGLRPEQVLHVGDNHEHDLEGAARAGLTAVGIRRGGSGQDPCWIPHLAELLQRV